jgi:tRNA(fMet)-specific endonuclease VapC
VIFALDTNTLIYFFKGIGQVAEHLFNTPPPNIAIPAVVLYELEVGIAKSSSSGRRRAKLDELIEVVSLLPLGRNEAHAAAAVRADLERHGKPIGPLDTLIAGTALANRATLVTHNTREFGRVPNLEIVDWY